MSNRKVTVYPAVREMELPGRDVRVGRMVIVIPKGATKKDRFAAEPLRDWVADDTNRQRANTQGDATS